MAVYDCCTFFNENDLFEIRLNQHWDFVDKFIVVEAGETHTGIKKPFNFDHERFKPYAEKIVYRTFDSFKETIKSHPEYYDPFNAQINDFKQEWINDNYQQSYVQSALKELGAQDSDIILVQPVDEIIRKEAFYQALEVFKDPSTYTVTDPQGGRLTVKDMRPMFAFQLDLYVFKFNWLARRNNFDGQITEYCNYKKVIPLTARFVGLHTHPPIPNGGWHFSYADSGVGEKVLYKMRSFAHATDPGRGINGKTKMQSSDEDEAIQILVNEFHPQVVPMTAETHPEYVLNNLEKYKDYILPLDSDI
jgi:beta-1,4-mannosyl-glycoprotein beta-1,4-N-acetylglucosaminyltransferase